MTEVFLFIYNNLVLSNEVEKGLSKMIGGKSPGLDQCEMKCLEKGGTSMIERNVRVINCCYETERVQKH